MFDPFGDFETEGYLRNRYREKDSRIIKRVEHEVFTRQLPNAIRYLSSKSVIAYEDFLAVHQILFSEFYAWAGQDRSITMPNALVSKAGILFSHPQDAKRAVDEGLRLGQIKEVMNTRPGEIMGLFAYGHPFLDGNGRTMLLVHLELAYRAGFSIAWEDTNKDDYLAALSEEIRTPNHGILDAYLSKLKGERLERNAWGKNILTMKGLDGLDDNNQVDGDLSDPAVADRYRQFEQRRGYTYEDHDEEAVCSKCHAAPCICGNNKPRSSGYSM